MRYRAESSVLQSLDRYKKGLTHMSKQRPANGRHPRALHTVAATWHSRHET